MCALTLLFDLFALHDLMLWCFLWVWLFQGDCVLLVILLLLFAVWGSSLTWFSFCLDLVLTLVLLVFVFDLYGIV